MHTPPSSEHLREEILYSRIRFIEVELDLGITFCSIASTTDDADSRERNIANARKASGTAAVALNGLTIPTGVSKRLHDKLSKLNLMLDGFQAGR